MPAAVLAKQAIVVLVRGRGVVMQRDDAKPVAQPQRVNRKARTLAEWCTLRRYQYTVVTGTGK